MFMKTNDITSMNFADPDTLTLTNSNQETIRKIPLDRTGQMRITYYGGINKFRVIPYVCGSTT